MQILLATDSAKDPIAALRPPAQAAAPGGFATLLAAAMPAAASDATAAIAPVTGAAGEPGLPPLVPMAMALPQTAPAAAPTALPGLLAAGAGLPATPPALAADPTAQMPATDPSADMLAAGQTDPAPVRPAPAGDKQFASQLSDGTEEPQPAAILAIAPLPEMVPPAIAPTALPAPPIIDPAKPAGDAASPAALTAVGASVGTSLGASVGAGAATGAQAGMAQDQGQRDSQRPADLAASPQALLPDTGAATPSGETGAAFAALTAALGAPAPGAAPTPAPVLLPMGQQGWIDQLAEQANAMAAQLASAAGGPDALTLTLTPERLGQLQIRLEIVDGQTHVHFVTETPETARLMADAAPRLQDLMARAGLELGSQTSGSFAQGSARQDQPPQPQPEPGAGRADPAHDTAASPRFSASDRASPAALRLSVDLLA